MRTEGKGQARAVDVHEGAVWEGFLLEEGPGLAHSLFSGAQQEMSFSERELGQGLPGSPRDLGLGWKVPGQGGRSLRSPSRPNPLRTATAAPHIPSYHCPMGNQQGTEHSKDTERRGRTPKKEQPDPKPDRQKQT